MRELLFDCDEPQAETWSDALLDAGALAVTVNDANDGTAAEQPLYGEPGMEPAAHAWSRNRLMVILPEGADAKALLQQTAQAVGLPVPEWQVRELPDADWVRLTQAQFEPIPIGERVLIVPSWHEVPSVPASTVIIRLDPGLAFGTGSHPTTHLCP